MNAIIEWFARHSIAANLLVVATVICGILAGKGIPKEIIPAVEPDNLTITADLPGASPSVVETSLCTPIENGIRNLPDIAHVRSLSSSNQCVVNVELAASADTKKTIADISAGLNLLPLPAQAGKPLIANTRKEPIITRLSVSGRVDYRLLHDTAKRVASELQAAGISKVKVIETKKRQIAVEVSPALLQQYQISMAEIASVLRMKGSTMPGGNMGNSKESSIIVSSEFSNIPELGNTVIRSLPDGTQLRLQDIADIHEEYSNLEARVNGQPSVAVVIYQGSNTDLFEISDIARRYVEKTTASLPQGINLDIVFDNAQFFSARMHYLQSNFISGLLVSSVILLLWLRLRLAFWITIDIPIVFSGGLIWLYLMDGSLNMVSAFGLIVVLGIVCDDAIVIGENIYRHQCSGKPGLEGAITGVQEVAKTVIFAVSTTVLMFIPLLFLPGSEGKLMQPLPMIIIAILIASLVEALLVLPTHLAHHSHFTPAKTLGYGIAEKMDNAILTLYRPLLGKALQWRYGIVAVCTALFVISISLVLSGTVKVIFFSAIETEIATGAVSFPNSNDNEKTRMAVRKMEQAALALQHELLQEYGTSQIDIVRSFVAANATHGEVYLGLAKSGKRNINSNAIMQRWKEKTGTVAGASSLSFHATVDIDTSRLGILLSADNKEQLAKAATALHQQLQHYAGVSSVSNLAANSHTEIALQLMPDAFDMGLNLQALAAQLHIALEETTVQQINGDDLVLKLAGARQLTLAELSYLPVQVSPVNTVPLSSVATVHVRKSAENIQHVDGQTVAIITADIDNHTTNANAVLKQLDTDFLQSLDSNFPGVSWKKTGVQEAESKIRNYLAVSFILSLLAMFVMLAVFLNSYFQPLMIFTAIPFGIVGALFGHLVFGQQLTLWSLAGMIAVSGIVVNNNMVIIFFINERLAAGENLANTLLMAGADRFRPIMLTTITTFAGVFPTILGNSWEAQFLIPLAISIGCGVMFAAVLTLFLVPCLYLVTDDIKQRLMRESN